MTQGGVHAARSTRTIIFVLLTLFLALFFLPQFISFYVDWLWFKDVRFEKIFTTKINAQAITAFAGIVAGFVITYVNILFSMRLQRAGLLL